MRRTQKIFIVIAASGLLSVLVLFLWPRAIEIAPLDATDNDNGAVREEPYVSPFKHAPPFPVKAIYLTPYSAASQKRFSDLLSWVKESELNAMVIDIKDATGRVYFNSNEPLAREIGATDEAFLDLRDIVTTLHANGIYAIARMVVFQDPILANARPQWAVQYSDGRVWRDDKGLSWLDPAAHEAWEYNFALAHEAIRAGFDEINFDYIRFPSDGDLERAVFPIWQEQTTMVEAMERFYEATWRELSVTGAKLSADIFGLSFYDSGDLGIGQQLERILPYFDYVAPMTYPSHYGPGLFGFSQPALHPYEVVLTTLQKGQQRINALAATVVDPAATTTDIVERARAVKPYGDFAKVRPWLQDFDLLGIPYTKAMVEAQIRAAKDAGAFGFMLWDPHNTYTRNLFD